MRCLKLSDLGVLLLQAPGRKLWPFRDSFYISTVSLLIGTDF